MKFGLRCAIACVIGCWSASVLAQSEFDSISRVGDKGPPAQGNLVPESSTAYEVVLKQNNVDLKVPINEIKWIDFQGSPLAMTSANRYAYDGKMKELQAALDRMQVGNLQPDAATDFAFYECLVPAKNALSGSGDLTTAGAALIKWTDAHPKHYRYLQACELLGDIFVALGKLDYAKKYYTEVAKAPIPDYKLRAAVALGRAYLSQGKVDEADRAFDVGLNAKAENDALNAAAQVGKAQCLADKEPQKAVKFIKDAIENTDSTDIEQSARAYNALGYAYEKLYALNKKPEDMKEAFYSFLKVDLLYGESGDAHAEALYHLIKHWNLQKKPERANDARDTLAKQYPNSRWKKLADGASGRTGR